MELKYVDIIKLDKETNTFSKRMEKTNALSINYTLETILSLMHLMSNFNI
jgi:hypothetical protein